MMSEFVQFQKIARLSREVVITEKIDGTNGLIAIGENGEFEVGSRNRWITPKEDNYGFARWAYEHKDELIALGAGFHYGEWWGQGIQRGYGLKEKRFSLFNSYRWSDELGERPACCHVVPVLYSGVFDTTKVDEILRDLATNGSKAAPGFMKPEGVVIYHLAGKVYFKKTIEGDEQPKSINQTQEQ
jgi:hypothetical protein